MSRRARTRLGLALALALALYWTPEARTPLTGLDWPSNGEGETRFALTGSDLPTIVPLTIIWRVYPVQQTGYYTTFFWADQQTDFINDVKDDGYFGCHPYPQGGASGTTHNWEIAIEGNDDITDDNGNSTVVTKGQWYQQAAIATQVGNELHVVFYWDLAVNSNRVITYETTTSVMGSHSPTDPGLMVGGNPWNPNNELLSGIVRGLQVYQGALSLSAINTLRVLDTDADVLAAQSGLGLSSLWYLNMNPTPSDITDKSGNGHHPTWANANRPALWSEGAACTRALLGVGC